MMMCEGGDEGEGGSIHVRSGGRCALCIAGGSRAFARVLTKGGGLPTYRPTFSKAGRNRIHNNNKFE